MGSTQKSTIPACFVNEALVAVVERGFNPNDLLMRAGIPPGVLADPAARITASQYGALWHVVAETLDDEFFGMGTRPMKRGSFTLLCHAIINSDTLERAIHRALRFLRLVVDDIKGTLHEDGSVAHIVLEDAPLPRTAQTPAPGRAFLYSTYFVLLHGLSCWLIGQRIPLLQVGFRCSRPPYSTELKNLFSENLIFDQPVSRLTFDSKYLQMKNVRNERTMKKFLRGAPANFLVRYKDLNSISAQVRRHLRDIEPSDWPDFPALAHEFGYSTATLRRRLNSEGYSYRAITNELRKNLAVSLLADKTQSMAEIAACLGFTEYSSFYRAFKKWAGTSPSTFRQATTPAAPSSSGAPAPVPLIATEQ